MNYRGRSGNSVDLHPGKAFCPAPGAWMPVFWWRGRRWAALCAVAGHPGPSLTPAEWEWALATAWGNPGGPPWLSAPQFGWLSVVKQRQEEKMTSGKYYQAARGSVGRIGYFWEKQILTECNIWFKLFSGLWSIHLLNMETLKPFPGITGPGQRNTPCWCPAYQGLDNHSG